MSFEAEGGELSNIERGTRMAQPGPEDLEIVPGGLLSGGRAKVLPNIGEQVTFDPASGQSILVPLVDPETGEDVIQKLAGKRMGEDIGVRGRGGSAGLGTKSSIGIYGTELSEYGTGAQTKTGQYTAEASQVPSLVNPEPIQRKTGGYFTYPQQRESVPQKFTQEATPERLASVQLSEAVRKSQVQIPKTQGPVQSPTDFNKYFEYGLFTKKPSRETVVTQLSFPSDIVPSTSATARTRVTPADVAANQLEQYMSKLQRGRATPLTSEVRIQPRLF
jgi:hypothetical protein